MTNWFLRGASAGIRTESVPAEDQSRALSPGLPTTTECPTMIEAVDVERVCPTGAIAAVGTTSTVDVDRCVLCMRCRESQGWRNDLRWAHPPEGNVRGPLSRRFARSLHVRIVDAGDCGSCLNELAQMNGPSYNLHQYGIFVTPTPRQADVLLAVGPATRQMHAALRAAYDAMPDPKRVVAVGVCAATGGVFGPSLMSSGGIAEVIPVDLVVPGCPPPPFAIIDALRSVCGQV